MQMLGGRGGGTAASGFGGGSQATPQASPEKQPSTADAGFGDFDDDIPF
jgi:single-stranded DNA-binding protein